MAEPEINMLAARNPDSLDEVCILSNDEAMPSSAKVVPIQAAGAPPRKTRTLVRTKRTSGPAYPQSEEVAAFFKAIHNNRDRAIFRLMYHAGLRASEIGLLEMRDYNAKTDRISVERLKGSNSGEHPLCREESRALRAWLKERGTMPGAIFPSRKGGPISRKMLDVLVKKYAAAAGLPPKLRHCHMFKHACCTHLLSKGFNVEQVRDWVGHADIRNTMIYAKVTNRRRDEMAAALRDTWK
jgi:integrase